MKKIISLSIVVVSIVVFFVWLYRLAVDTRQPEVPILPQPDYSERLILPEGKRTVNSEAGPLQITDITIDPVAFYDGNVVAFVDNSDFSIVYYGMNDQFLITLKREDDFTFARVYAEETFLKKLDITQTQACTLAVDLIIPPYINFDLAGSYGLSFCPGAVAVP